GHLGSRCNQENRDAEIGDAGDEGRRPSRHTCRPKQAEMHVPEDTQARSAEICRRACQVLIDLGQSAAKHLVAERNIRKGKCQNHQCGGPGKRYTSAAKEEQIADTDKDTGNGSREHTKKIDRAAKWYRALVDQKGSGHRKESRSKPGKSRIDKTISKVIGFGGYHWPLVERKRPVHTPGFGECADNDAEIEAQDNGGRQDADCDQCPCDRSRQGQTLKRAAAARNHRVLPLAYPKALGHEEKQRRREE